MVKKKVERNAPVDYTIKPPYKLEIGRHTFKDRILEQCIYVDKTKYIYNLINRDSNCFLSRPRRFGKSLLISTIKEIFSGSQELFKNCWIYDQIEWLEYPIIHLDFITVDYKTIGLERALSKKLDVLAAPFNITLTGETIHEKFLQLIEMLAKDKKVVILIDEYDKPIIDYIENIPEAEKNRDILKNFYSILKALSSYIRFLLITGVSKFSKISIFSDLNHLNDITLHPEYAQMLGYTLDEIKSYFSDYIEKWEKRIGQNREALFEKLKDYYNGYSWDGTNFVYNPFSILSFFGTYQFNNYWFATGTPTFLVNKMKSYPDFIPQYEHYEVDAGFFDKFDLSDIDLSTLLFQTGYLTIKEINDQSYILSYPNREVRVAFLKNLLEGFSRTSYPERNKLTRDIKQTLEKYEIDGFIECIKALLASIPYNIQIENREAYYHSLIYIALQLSMLEVHAEIQTAIGRSDIVISLNNSVYIIEFKMGSAQSALEQIESKQYYGAYLGKNKKIILLGIGLDGTQRNIADWKTREIDAEEKTVRNSMHPKNENEMGKKEEKLRMAKLMLEKNYPMDDIILLTGLSEKEIKAVIHY